MPGTEDTKQPKTEELTDEALDEVQGGNWLTQAQKTAKSVSKKFNDTANAVIKNI